MSPETAYELRYFRWRNLPEFLRPRLMAEPAVDAEPPSDDEARELIKFAAQFGGRNANLRLPRDLDARRVLLLVDEAEGDRLFPMTA